MGLKSILREIRRALTVPADEKERAEYAEKLRLETINKLRSKNESKTFQQFPQF